ncbi:hypothetical protein D1BOALGB6SA_6662 [Olavius sp. associated proteobacterium Delta 1]|nr:hypothetical protein D1BOALGB6SA_6662 [Olavius sp. associated proteobacterium Delta 1]
MFIGHRSARIHTDCFRRMEMASFSAVPYFYLIKSCTKNEKPPFLFPF